jgi:hypothetical protein
LTSSSDPILSPHCRIYRSGGQVIVEGVDATYRFRGKGAMIVDAVKHHLDGTRSLDTIAEEVALPVAEIAAALSVLLETELLVDISDALNATSSHDFLEYYFRLCDDWGRGIFTRPFWLELMTGQASRALVLGWGMEFYHRVMAADVHNSLAVHFCADDRLRELLVDHFLEEVDHGAIFLDGLEASGIDRDAVQASIPLPGSVGLFQYLNGLAVADTLTYMGCYGVMHSPRVGQTVERINAQFDGLINQYPFATGLLEKIREHALLDVGLGHDEIVLERYLLHRGAISRDEGVRIIGAARGITQSFVTFFDGIYASYASSGTSLHIPSHLA